MGLLMARTGRLDQAVAFYRRHGVTMAGGATAFYQMFLAEQRKQHADQRERERHHDRDGLHEARELQPCPTLEPRPKVTGCMGAVGG